MTSIRSVYQMDADNVSFKVQGISGLALPSSVTNIDFKLPEARYLTGGQLLVSGGAWGDTVTIQVIDIDGLYGAGPNLVLGEFVTNLCVNPSSTEQIHLECPYVALIPMNIYLRMKYTNTDVANTAKVAMNIFSHIPK